MGSRVTGKVIPDGSLALTTLTGVSGYAIRGTDLNLLGPGPTVRAAPDGSIVRVAVLGRQ